MFAARLLTDRSAAARIAVRCGSSRESVGNSLKKIHLAQFLTHGPSHHSLAMWRHPQTAAAAYDWKDPRLYEHIARTCERGLFDMVFFADLNYISDTFTGSLAPALRYAAQAPEHDPIPLLTWLAATTQKIGLAATFSTSNQHPFYAARMWATIDHISGGRAGWNVVTSLNHNQQANYGVERAATDERYDRALEYMQVCCKLWHSWDRDAEVQDRHNALFANPDSVRRIEHVGQFFKSRGPLNVVRSPQDGPAILQAGTSSKGREFAALYADAIFAIQPRAEDAARYYQSIKGLLRESGRDPDHCKILFGMQPIIGATETEARDKQREHNELVPLEAGLTILSAHLDFDLSTIALEDDMSARPEPALQRMRTRFLHPDGSGMTLREVAQRHGQSVGLPQFVGTAESIADQMQAYIETAGGDGFMLSAIYSPGAIDEFVDQVVPILQDRGLFRREYVGETMRDLLRQD